MCWKPEDLRPPKPIEEFAAISEAAEHGREGSEAMRRWGRDLTAVVAALGTWSCATVRYSEDHDWRATLSSAATYAWQSPTGAQRERLERIDPFLERRIQRAVDEELGRRGFGLVPPREADLLVTAHPLPLSARGDRTGNRPAGRPRTTVSVGIGVGFGPRYGVGPSHGFRCGCGYPYGNTLLACGSPYVWLASPRRAYRHPHAGVAGPWWPSRPRLRYSVAVGGRRQTAPGDRGFGTLVVEFRDARSEEIVWQGRAYGALSDMPPTDKREAFVNRIVHRLLRGFPPDGAAK